MNSKDDKESDTKDHPTNLLDAVRAGWDEIVMNAIRANDARHKSDTYLQMERVGIHYARLFLLDHEGILRKAYFGSVHVIEAKAKEFIEACTEHGYQVHVVRDLDGKVNRFAARRLDRARYD